MIGKTIHCDIDLEEFKTDELLLELRSRNQESISTGNNLLNQMKVEMIANIIQDVPIGELEEFCEKYIK